MLPERLHPLTTVPIGILFLIPWMSSLLECPWYLTLVMENWMPPPFFTQPYSTKQRFIRTSPEQMLSVLSSLFWNGPNKEDYCSFRWACTVGVGEDVTRPGCVPVQTYRLCCAGKAIWKSPRSVAERQDTHQNHLPQIVKVQITRFSPRFIQSTFLWIESRDPSSPLRSQVIPIFQFRSLNYTVGESRSTERMKFT